MPTGPQLNVLWLVQGVAKLLGDGLEEKEEADDRYRCILLRPSSYGLHLLTHDTGGVFDLWLRGT